MKYCIEFKFEAVRNQYITSRVYAKTIEDARKAIQDHIDDITSPRMEKWRLYQLIDEGERKDDSANY